MNQIYGAVHRPATHVRMSVFFNSSSPSFLAQPNVPQCPAVSGCKPTVCPGRILIKPFITTYSLYSISSTREGPGRCPEADAAWDSTQGTAVNISSPTDHRKSIWSHIGHYKAAALYKAAVPSQHPPPPPPTQPPLGGGGEGEAGLIYHLKCWWLTLWCNQWGMYLS